MTGSILTTTFDKQEQTVSNGNNTIPIATRRLRLTSDTGNSKPSISCGKGHDVLDSQCAKAILKLLRFRMSKTPNIIYAIKTADMTPFFSALRRQQFA